MEDLNGKLLTTLSLSLSTSPNSSGPLIQLPYMYAHKEDHERAEFYDNTGFELSAILGLAMFGTAVALAGGEGGMDGDCCDSCGDIDCGDICGECCTVL